MVVVVGVAVFVRKLSNCFLLTLSVLLFRLLSCWQKRQRGAIYERDTHTHCAYTRATFDQIGSMFYVMILHYKVTERNTLRFKQYFLCCCCYVDYWWCCFRIINCCIRFTDQRPNPAQVSLLSTTSKVSPPSDFFFVGQLLPLANVDFFPSFLFKQGNGTPWIYRIIRWLVCVCG